MFRGALYAFVFLLCVAVLAKTRAGRIRLGALLTGSYVLYITWDLWFAGVLLASSTVNFLFGRWLRRKPSLSRLVAGLAFNLALLSIFKYLPDAAVNSTLPALQPFARLVLPLGMSFWTFQAMSYLFDLYRGEELDPSFPEFALYMAFFPVAISGPICRIPDMLPQIRSQKLTAWNEIAGGIGRIATGVLMMLCARLLGQGILSGDGIDRGFDRVSSWSGPDVWCLALGYALQLFFDFAGYSHIAIGAAQALGFSLPENFDRPFQSTTPSIFWTRWHMSLSFWIRDYVFFPLATMRREVIWRNFVLIVSMVIFGLWHKATILFLLWGCYHGVLLATHRIVQQVGRRWAWKPPSALWLPLSWIATMAAINLGWILFRANSLAQCGKMFSAILSVDYRSHLLSGSLYVLVLAFAAAYALVLWIGERFESQAVQSTSFPDSRRAGFLPSLYRNRWYWMPPLYGLALFLVFLVTHGQDSGAAQFMYRRF